MRIELQILGKVLPGFTKETTGVLTLNRNAGNLPSQATLIAVNDAEWTLTYVTSSKETRTLFIQRSQGSLDVAGKPAGKLASASQPDPK